MDLSFSNCRKPYAQKASAINISAAMDCLYGESDSMGNMTSMIRWAGTSSGVLTVDGTPPQAVPQSQIRFRRSYRRKAFII